MQPLGVLGLDVDHVLVRRALGGVEVLHEVGDAALVVVGHRARRVLGRVDAVELDVDRVGLALVGEGEGQALVEEGHLLEAARQRGEVVVRGLEDRRRRPRT